MADWIKRSSNSVWMIDNEKNIYVSYNPCVGKDVFGADKFILDLSETMTKLKNGGEETALCYNGKYLILNGDWRNQFENAFNIGGLEEMIKLWEDNVEHQSKWSDEP